MPFLPSIYSVHLSPDYGATWRLGNVFTRAGRAENKQARAQKKRAKAKTASGKKQTRLRRQADRLGVRAAELKYRGAGIPPLFENATKLWRVRYPWGQRTKRKGLLDRARVMRFQAKGHRPARQLINLEYRATIAGGITVLATAFDPETGGQGYAPYNSINYDALVAAVRATGQKADKDFVAAAAAAAQAQGLKVPKTLKSASGFIRDEVIKRGLEEAAWSMRALCLVNAATRRSDIRTKVGAGVASAAVTSLLVACTIVTAGACSVAAAPILAGGAAVVGVVGSTFTAAGQIQKARLGSEWAAYQEAVTQAQQQRAVKLQVSMVQLKAAALEDIQAELEDATQAKLQTSGLLFALSGLASFGLYKYFSARRAQ